MAIRFSYKEIILPYSLLASAAERKVMYYSTLYETRQWLAKNDTLLHVLIEIQKKRRKMSLFMCMYMGVVIVFNNRYEC